MEQSGEIIASRVLWINKKKIASIEIGMPNTINGSTTVRVHINQNGRIRVVDAMGIDTLDTLLNVIKICNANIQHLSGIEGLLGRKQ